MSCRSFIKTSVPTVFMAGGFTWLLSHQAILPLAESGQGEMAGMEMPGMKKKDAKTGSGEQSVGTESAREPESVPGIVTIPPERLQTIGVKYGQVTRRPLEKTIRTVGRVAVDERRLAKVTIKFHGGSKSCSSARLGIM
ncbi:MAG: hypothetical protein U0361_21835 [Nitrospiraceae bacterium]